MRLTKATIITGRQVQDQALSQFIMQETERQWIDSNDSVGLARGSSAAQQTSIFTTCSCSATCRATKQSFCTSGQVHSTKITLLSKRSVSVPNGGSWWASIYVAAEETMNIWPLLKQASRHKMYIGAPFDALEWRWIMFQQLEDISIQSRGWCLEYCFCITWFSMIGWQASAFSLLTDSKPRTQPLAANEYRSVMHLIVSNMSKYLHHWHCSSLRLLLQCVNEWKSESARSKYIEAM